jgi:beta-lactamase superfamily II metal-dependent hydrolase|tara:strand:+ start:15610 stop:16620 length:1011 start_codon:yes stop_codon:yes gene_type:complete
MRHCLFIVLFLAAPISWADDPGGDTLYTRIVDTGPGLCTITRMPGPHYLVYDTGHWNGAVLCDLAVKRIVPAGATIDLLVLSHSDADHLGATDEILATYPVKRVVRTGDVRWDTATWRNAYWSIRRKREAGELDDINLWTLPDKAMPPGETYTYGETELVFVSGFNDPPPDWGISVFDQSKMNNAISIVVRLAFAGRAILFTGDAVGRTGDGDKDCWATEKYMVDNTPQVPLQSDVLIAPHHGADNASSRCFIEAVDPDWVIFPAGSDHEHPREATAQRYLTHGVARERIFRTDLGDDEGEAEWAHGASPAGDSRGDDDIEIIITARGEVTVRYAD